MERILALISERLEMPLGLFLLQSLWIAARLILVFYLGSSGAIFFYQNF